MLLTDEEIEQINIEWLKQSGMPDAEEYEWSVCVTDQLIAKAQLKKIVKWGIGFCRHKDGPLFKRECPHCWQDLLDEVGE